MKQLLPLNESEAIFAPFHDSTFSSELGLTLQPESGLNFYSLSEWDCTRLVWDACEVGKVAGAVELPMDFPMGNYDELVFCLTISSGAAVQFSTQSADGNWQALGSVVEGGLSRQEIVRPMPPNGATALRIEAIARDATAQSIKLTWFAVRNRKLTELVLKNRVRWNPAWDGLIKPEPEWGELKFRRGLLFQNNQISGLRAKKLLPGWREHFSRMEMAARKAMERQPEEELLISDYAPFPDERYVRETERGRLPFYYDALKLALVGLVNEDNAMIRHALRFLMSMLHLKYWSSSAETRATGSTWDQRCFTEEMTTTSAAVLMDWLDGALTDRARGLGYTMLWDRGLSVIERDMAKFEYVHHINQGPWFCRARIFAGLLLEKEWPRLGEGYADRAVTQMREGLDRYLQTDGGMDEGPMYLLATLETTLSPLIAYAGVRGIDVRELLPKALSKTPDYIQALAQSQPGLHVPHSDCSSEFPGTDSIPILASLFPGSLYEKLARGALLADRPYTYSNHYVGTGLFSFIHGPDQLEPLVPVPATFSFLPMTGLASSYRVEGEHSLRLVFTGSKADPSHSHADKGQFHAEVDGEAVFVDRGTVRYDDPRAFLLTRSECHNVLAPSFDGVTTGEQSRPRVPMIPQASGDEKRFSARIDLAPVWQGSMVRYTRAICSENVSGWTITDEGELSREGEIVFFLQSRYPFEGSGISWKSGRVTIQAPWAMRADTAELHIDCEFRPIYRLRLWSQRLRSFNLATFFTTS